jgi:hypothetical protein
MDRGLLVGLGRVDEIGKEVRPVREKLALEPLVQEPEQQLPGMKPVAFCPIAEVARPVVACGEPSISAAMQPACLFVGSEALETPRRSLLVEPFSGPFHHDERATACERAGDAVDDLGWIGNVME